MSTNWSPILNKRYLKDTAEEMLAGIRLFSLLGTILFLLFSLVDYFSQSRFFYVLTSIRLVTVFIYAASYLLLSRSKLQRWPIQTAVFLIIVATVSLTLMCMATGGLSSPYYAGINVVIMSTILIYPVGVKKLSWTILMVISIYLCGMLISHPALENPARLINNLSFIFSTAIIGFAAALVAEKLRRKSFLRFLELEQTKALLQGQLHGQQGNIQTLTYQLIERQKELENALTLMRSAKEEAQGALQLREEFISLASHELKTPLTVLKLQTQMVQRQLSHPESKPVNTKKLLDTYEFQVKRLTRMVEDMLDISRIKSGNLHLDLSHVDLTELVEKLINGFKDSFEAEGISISFNATESVKGYWDAFRIEQVVLNLITNALKYGRGKPIEVIVRRKGESAFISVKDHGIGIYQEHQTKIFKRFERAVSASEFSGLGLGLYISSKIIQAHAGNITVESELGKGSLFTIRIPFNLYNEDIDTLIEELTTASIYHCPSSAKASAEEASS